MKGWQVPGLFAANLVVSVLASIGFKYSALSQRWTGFWLYQILGNLAGFAGVLILTMLLRAVPMHIVYPISQGLAILGIQVVAARLIFHEAITASQWLGTLLVVSGIVLVSARR